MAALLAGAVCFGAVPLAHAAFFGSASATSSFTVATLEPPTDLLATKRCSLDVLGLLAAASLDLTWTPSASSWASGQRIVVTDAGGVLVATKELSPATSSTTVELPLVNTGPYTSSVRATYGSWSSPVATVTTSGC